MTAPHGHDLEHRDDLEQRLTELFQQRAASVTRARPVEFGSGGDSIRTEAANSRQVRLGTHRQNLGVLAAAAAVFVAVAATVLGIQTNRHQQAPPVSSGSHPVSTPTASPISTPTSTLYEKACPAPASWRQAISAGAFPVDRSLNSVASANGDIGDYLAVQGNEPPSGSSALYRDVELAVFHGKGGRTIYVAEHSDDVPKADPTGAISADWITFALAHPQNLNYSYRMLLYQRRTQETFILADASDPRYLGRYVFIDSPVIAAGKVYWLKTVYNHPETTRLEFSELARGAAVDSVPAANATGLVSYGSGVALIKTVAGRTTVSNGAGAPLTQLQLHWMSLGSNFGFDGARKLSWMSHDDGVGGYENLLVGAEGTNSEGLIWQTPGSGPAIYPFVEVTLDDADPAAGQNAVADVRTNRAVALPPGVEFEAVVGNSVVFGTGATKSGAAGLSIVALSALPPVSCERP